MMSLAGGRDGTSKLRRIITHHQQQSLHLHSNAAGEYADEDSQHLFLPPHLLERARAIFDAYCAREEQLAPSKCVTERRGLPVRALERFLNDVGVPTSENQAKDVIFRMSQSEIVLRKNQESDRKAAGVDTTSRPNEESGEKGDRHPKTAVKTEAGDENNLHLSFALFLELLVTTLPDCNQQLEMEQVWSQLDGDGDGVLSVEDLRQALRDAPPNDVLADATDDELHVALLELDLDNDGRVNFLDFARAVDTS